MTRDAAKALSRQSLGMWAGDAPDVSGTVFAPDYRNHQEPAAGGGVKTIGLTTGSRSLKPITAPFPTCRSSS